MLLLVSFLVFLYLASLGPLLFLQVQFGISEGILGRCIIIYCEPGAKLAKVTPVYKKYLGWWVIRAYGGY